LIKSVSKLKNKQNGDRQTTKTGSTSVKTTEILKMFSNVNKAAEVADQLEQFNNLQK